MYALTGEAFAPGPISIDVRERTESYSIPGLQKWALLLAFNVLFLISLSIGTIFMFHHKELDGLIFTLTHLVEFALLSGAAIAVSMILDYGAVTLYRTSNHARYRAQLGQVCDYSSLFTALCGLAILAPSTVAFIRAIGSALRTIIPALV